MKQVAMKCVCAVCRTAVEVVDCVPQRDCIVLRLICHGQIEEILLHAGSLVPTRIVAGFRNVRTVECANG